MPDSAIEEMLGSAEHFAKYADHRLADDICRKSSDEMMWPLSYDRPGALRPMKPLAGRLRSVIPCRGAKHRDAWPRARPHISIRQCLLLASSLTLPRRIMK